jgi:hypothetical protein
VDKGQSSQGAQGAFGISPNTSGSSAKLSKGKINVGGGGGVDKGTAGNGE